MSNKFEKSIQEWYNNSPTADLGYLNLPSQPKTSDYLNTITNNISVLYEHQNLSSRNTFKYFEILVKQNQDLLKLLKEYRQELSVLQEQLKELKPVVCEKHQPIVSFPTGKYYIPSKDESNKNGGSI